MTQNSTTGTASTEISLDALSICRIIRESARCGVKDLTIGKLKISFGSESKLELTKQMTFEPALAGPPEKSDDIEAPPVNGLLLTDEQKEALEAFTETQLMIDDPAAFEDIFISEAYGDGARGRGNVKTHHSGSQ